MIKIFKVHCQESATKNGSVEDIKRIIWQLSKLASQR